MKLSGQLKCPECGESIRSLADCAPAVDEPYIWLNEDEEQGAADCGCRLVRDHKGGGPAFFVCAAHGGSK